MLHHNANTHVRTATNKRLPVGVRGGWKRSPSASWQQQGSKAWWVWIWPVVLNCLSVKRLLFLLPKRAKLTFLPQFTHYYKTGITKECYLVDIKIIHIMLFHVSGWINLMALHLINWPNPKETWECIWVPMSNSWAWPFCSGFVSFPLMQAGWGDGYETWQPCRPVASGCACKFLLSVHGFPDRSSRASGPHPSLEFSSNRPVSLEMPLLM